MTRRAASAASAALLLVLVVASQPLAELPRRLQSLAAFAPKELAVRRLGGSGTAFDRRFFSFLENARRRLPPTASGVALYGAPREDAYIFLASYQLAPLPVLLSPEHPPARWVAAVYGAERPPGARVLAELPEGALIEVGP